MRAGDDAERSGGGAAPMTVRPELISLVPPTATAS